MGIINNDVYICSNGVQKAGTYISFASETLYVVQNYNMTNSSSPASYNVRANYRIFWDQACREEGKTFIDLKSIHVTLTSEQLNSNIYSILYAELKTLYPNSVDETSIPVVADAPVVNNEPAVADEPVVNNEPVVTDAPITAPITPSN